MVLYHMHTYEMEDKLPAIHTLLQKTHKHWYDRSNKNLNRNSDYITHKIILCFGINPCKCNITHQYLYRLKFTNYLFIFLTC